MKYSSSKIFVVNQLYPDGLGRKVGDLCQYFAQVVGSFLVGFYLCWKLTLVLLAAFPCIAGAGAFMIVAITSAQVSSHSIVLPL